MSDGPETGREAPPATGALLCTSCGTVGPADAERCGGCGRLMLAPHGTGAQLDAAGAPAAEAAPQGQPLASAGLRLEPSSGAAHRHDPSPAVEPPLAASPGPAPRVDPPPPLPTGGLALGWVAAGVGLVFAFSVIGGFLLGAARLTAPSVLMVAAFAVHVGAGYTLARLAPRRVRVEAAIAAVLSLAAMAVVTGQGTLVSLLLSAAMLAAAMVFGTVVAESRARRAGGPEAQAPVLP